MYRKTDCLLLPFTASAVQKNLFTKVGKNKKTVEEICVIHNDCVCLAPTRESQSSKSKYIKSSDFCLESDITVTQAALFKLGYETVLAVTSTVGLQLFSYNRNECLFTHPCVDLKKPNIQNYAIGIGVFEMDLFCVGNNAGCIRMFGLGEFYGEISFIDRKYYHNYGIVDLATYKDYLASVDEHGIIILWNLQNEELMNVATFTVNSNCTAVRLRRDWLIATFGSGHMRLYDISKITAGQYTSPIGQIAEVTAHARYITGLDIAHGNDLILTVSEDSYAKIWIIRKESGNYVIVHKCNILIKDSLLVGGRFLNSSGLSFCVSAYDNNIVTCYSMQ